MVDWLIILFSGTLIQRAVVISPGCNELANSTIVSPSLDVGSKEVVLSSCLNVTSELFGYSELLGVWKYRRLSDVRMDFGFSFDAAPTIDTVLHFEVSEMSEMNEDKIKMDR